MRINRSVQVQSDRFEILAVAESETFHRFHHGKRLDGLQRIEIVAISLVGEIKAGTHDSDTMDGACLQRSFCEHHPQRIFDRKVREKRSVHREATTRVKCSPSGDQVCFVL